MAQGGIDAVEQKLVFRGIAFLYLGVLGVRLHRRIHDLEYLLAVGYIEVEQAAAQPFPVFRLIVGEHDLGVEVVVLAHILLERLCTPHGETHVVGIGAFG